MNRILAILFWLCFAVLTLALAGAASGRIDRQPVVFGMTLNQPCRYRQATGENCGACGLTRAWIALAHRDVGTARSLNPEALSTFAGAIAFLTGGMVLLVLRLARRISTRLTMKTEAILFAMLAFSWHGVIARNVVLRTYRFVGGASPSVQPQVSEPTGVVPIQVTGGFLIDGKGQLSGLSTRLCGISESC